MRSTYTLVLIISRALCMVLLAAGCVHQPVSGTNNEVRFPPPVSSSQAPAAAPKVPKHANFEQEMKSEVVRQVADWVFDSGDNGGLNFAIIDKIDAKVYVFDPNGRLRGAAPVLLGLSKGDDTVPGIGDKSLSEIRPADRTTPAGRFLASMGDNISGKDVLWIDYKDALSMHRVITSNPKEHRLERLASPKPTEHRISFGCINVPADFFDKVVKPSFTGTGGMVYILPEIRPIKEVFVTYYEVEKGPEKVSN